jgi:hypothetical protein
VRISAEKPREGCLCTRQCRGSSSAPSIRSTRPSWGSNRGVSIDPACTAPCWPSSRRTAAVVPPGSRRSSRHTPPGPDSGRSRADSPGSDFARSSESCGRPTCPERSVAAIACACEPVTTTLWHPTAVGPWCHGNGHCSQYVVGRSVTSPVMTCMRYHECTHSAEARHVGLGLEYLRPLALPSVVPAPHPQTQRNGRK